ncbi:DUF1656 domain-containing protein [Methylobacterium durans]|uniref:DUF1656 domain-containing protein n=1 Tax=Methylobacterium durans TaxID=2202825 RepID=A0A2U8W8G7_9HYPH|nr:DUF1656 domain-containing protein [Methylobacterium durans]AWN42425.1 DUF1656 domain-containing protein [Methylobacterium durans]
MHRDLDLGGILISPFVAYTAASLVILVALRALFARIRLARYVANPPLVEAGLYICIVALMVALFR